MTDKITLINTVETAWASITFNKEKMQMKPLRLKGGRLASAIFFKVQGANHLQCVCFYNFVNKQDIAQTT
jgi:hypothetical protein